ncbi:MAG: protein kinase [Verrucomicrobiota bacterium]|nr:protein kinase [Verrucomicrobiota bacterium]
MTEDPIIGTVINGYEILGTIGKGGMGVVYKARQNSLDRIVALKVLPAQFTQEPDFILRFNREAKAAARLNHPNIIQVYDFGNVDMLFYFVMEFIEGCSIGDYIKEHGKFDERNGISVILQTCDALAFAHNVGIIHRDIKPDNLLLTKTGDIKLGDLGLAKQTNEEASLTQTGTAMGTPYYISPEQVRGDKEIDGRTDLYSLGATLFHLVTGRIPFEANTAAAIMSRHLNDEVEDPRNIEPVISESLSYVIKKMMQKLPANRYLKAEDIAHDLNLILEGKPIGHDSSSLKAMQAPSARKLVVKADSAPSPARSGNISSPPHQEDPIAPHSSESPLNATTENTTTNTVQPQPSKGKTSLRGGTSKSIGFKSEQPSETHTPPSKSSMPLGKTRKRPENNVLVSLCAYAFVILLFAAVGWFGYSIYKSRFAKPNKIAEISSPGPTITVPVPKNDPPPAPITPVVLPVKKAPEVEESLTGLPVNVRHDKLIAQKLKALKQGQPVRFSGEEFLSAAAIQETKPDGPQTLTDPLEISKGTRLFIRFDPPDFDNPEGKPAVTKCELVIYPKVVSTGEPIRLSLYRIKRDWLMGKPTWNSIATGKADWELPGADGPSDRELAPTSSVVIKDENPGGYRFDITQDMIGFKGNLFPNYGWLLICETEGTIILPGGLGDKENQIQVTLTLPPSEVAPAPAD